MHRTFPESSADQVWTAMVEAAQEPVYDDWTVRGNDVWVDEAGSRVELYRRLARIVHKPEDEPRREDRQFRLQVRLEQRDPPMVAVLSRGFAVPAHAMIEASRYLDLVEALLAGEVRPEDEAGLTDQDLLDAMGLDDSAPPPAPPPPDLEPLDLPPPEAPSEAPRDAPPGDESP